MLTNWRLLTYRLRSVFFFFFWGGGFKFVAVFLNHDLFFGSLYILASVDFQKIVGWPTTPPWILPCTDSPVSNAESIWISATYWISHLNKIVQFSRHWKSIKDFPNHPSWLIELLKLSSFSIQSTKLLRTSLNIVVHQHFDVIAENIWFDIFCS